MTVIHAALGNKAVATHTPSAASRMSGGSLSKCLSTAETSASGRRCTSWFNETLSRIRVYTRPPDSSFGGSQAARRPAVEKAEQALNYLDKVGPDRFGDCSAVRPANLATSSASFLSSLDPEPLRIS